MITKAERIELKSVVRNQFRVLRGEVEQRKAEMHAEVEEQILQHFSADDQKWAGVQHVIHEAVMECNRAINNVLYDQGYQERGNTERLWIQTPAIQAPSREKVDLRRRADLRIAEQVKAARLRLDREEADLLRTLAVGAIESEEAREFLASIPSVGELVPSARLAELVGHIDTEPASDEL